jgi:hypothetical protein
MVTTGGDWQRFLVLLLQQLLGCSDHLQGLLLDNPQDLIFIIPQYCSCQQFFVF